MRCTQCTPRIADGRGREPGIDCCSHGGPRSSRPDIPGHSCWTPPALSAPGFLRRHPPVGLERLQRAGLALVRLRPVGDSGVQGYALAERTQLQRELDITPTRVRVVIFAPP